MTWSMTPDLAIIELNRIANLKPGVVSPICLPSEHVQDKPTKKVFITLNGQYNYFKYYSLQYYNFLYGITHFIISINDEYQIPIHAYVAGWGATSSQCDSNDNGPSPHKMCKFPFVWKGIVNKIYHHNNVSDHELNICPNFRAVILSGL